MKMQLAAKMILFFTYLSVSTFLRQRAGMTLITALFSMTTLF